MKIHLRCIIGYWRDNIVYLLFILGLILIIKGGDWFVDSAVWIAEITKIPPIIIGATIVSFATTLPELIVSVTANISGSSEMAIGNAVGSTICNIGLISSLTFIALKNKVNKKVFKEKSMIMILALLLFTIFAWNLNFSHLEGFITILIIPLFIYLSIKDGKVKEELKEEPDKSRKAVIKNTVFFILGAGAIILGASLLVDNGQIIARNFGVPEAIISLTMIALGTSLPELITTISSIRKQNQEIGLGNIIGANILNITLILPASSFISKGGLPIVLYDINIFGKVLNDFPSTLYIDMSFSLILMLIFSVPTMIKGETKRYQGFLMLFIYILYLIIRVGTGIGG